MPEFQTFQKGKNICCLCIRIIIFRANTLKDGFLKWREAFRQFNPWIFVDKSLLDLGLDRIEWEIFFIGLLVIVVVSVIKQLKGSVRDALTRQNFVFRLAVYLTIFMVTVIWGYYGAGFDAQSFIYGRF